MSLLPFPALGGNRRIGASGIASAAIGTTLLGSFVFYRDHGNQPSPTNWLFHSWPALLALGTACLLFQSSPALRWPILRKACRLLMLFLYFGGFLFFLRWPPFWSALKGLGFEDTQALGWLAMMGGLVWLFLSFRTAFGGLRFPAFGLGGSAKIAGTPRPDTKVTRPSATFADIGGYDAVKEQLRQVIENRLHPEKFGGIVRNGIVLHGPQGTGKTALARATAGEFRLNYLEVSSPGLHNMWVGETEANLRHIFDQAAKQKPTLLLIDEIDSLGAARGTGISPGQATLGVTTM